MQNEVVFYSTHCPRCKVLEMKLKAKNIEYIENNDTEEMLHLGLKSAPALKVGEKLMDFSEAVKWVNVQEGKE